MTLLIPNSLGKPGLSLTSHVNFGPILKIDRISCFLMQNARPPILALKKQCYVYPYSYQVSALLNVALVIRNYFPVWSLFSGVPLGL